MEEKAASAVHCSDERNRTIAQLNESLRSVQRELEEQRAAHREHLIETEERLGLRGNESYFR